MAEKMETSSNAIVSLTLGVLSILLPFIGLVIGVIGVVVSRKATKEISNTNKGGREFAVSGLICSLVGITIQTLAIVGILAFTFLISAG
ncbi:DUF4190 domain-containing protein [Virgibacillus sp. DJP39]|uniref:DUF4190 domain-containing protein n=1 Tax=Virgibacillus sp. DJP39 TaxID=3409790 RepID=UPI003BB7D4B0